MTKLRVATRKGLFTFVGESSRKWVLSGVEFLGDPVTMVLSDPRSGNQFAALNLGHFGVKMHRATAGDGSWQEIPAPKYPKAEGEAEGASLQQIWALACGGSDQPGRLWAGTIPGGLFRSDDHGATWQLVESLWNLPERARWVGGGYDQPGIHSICVDPRDSARLVLAVSCGGIWETLDDGATWSQQGQGLRAAYLPPEAAHELEIQDPHCMVVCPAAPDFGWIQHHNGIFRSTDGCRTWSEITDVNPSTFGFAVAVHPQDPNTAWFVPGVKDECRVPPDAKLVVTRTRDGGNTFTSLSDGLPAQDAYDLVFRHALDIDPSGERLAFGSTTGNLWLSENQGDSWHCLSWNLPPINSVRFDPV